MTRRPLRAGMHGAVSASRPRPKRQEARLLLALAGEDVAPVDDATDDTCEPAEREVVVFSPPCSRSRRAAALPDEVDDQAGKGFYATMPADQLSTLDRADAIMVVGTEAERAAFAALPGYGRLTLVQQSKVVALDDELSAALSFGSVLSLPSVVDELSGRIARDVER